MVNQFGYMLILKSHEMMRKHLSNPAKKKLHLNFVLLSCYFHSMKIYISAKIVSTLLKVSPVVPNIFRNYFCSFKLKKQLILHASFNFTFWNLNVELHDLKFKTIWNFWEVNWITQPYILWYDFSTWFTDYFHNSFLTFQLNKLP